MTDATLTAPTVTVIQKKQMPVTTLRARCGVRYWEDGTVNGDEDSNDSPRVPFAKGENWNIEIDLLEGRIKNWPGGTTASVHYKVCDNGEYYLEDSDGLVVAEIVNEYVPSILSPGDEGYGDYVIMQIGPDGKIADWKIDLSSFEPGDDD